MTQTVAEWLTSLEHENVRDCAITIKGTKYLGAQYHDKMYGREFIYLLGQLPACYKRSAKTVFRLNDDARDWYVCCYITKDRITKEFAPYHPFGETFMLAAWDAVACKGKIDQYDEFPRVRVNATRNIS